MNRRKKPSSSARISSPPLAKRRKIGLVSSSPVRRKTSDTVRPPPEYPTFDFVEKCPTLNRVIDGEIEELSAESEELIAIQHELESLLAESAMNVRKMSGELQFLTSGDYPKEDLRKRLMPKYETRVIVAPSSPNAILEKEGICGLPEEDEDDDLNQVPLHIPTRFWTWCKEDFLKNVDADYLQRFKDGIVDKYSNEGLSKYFVNEPWKHRPRTVPKRTSNRHSNGASSSSSKASKRVSISKEAECSNGKVNGRRSSVKVASRRNSEKDTSQNNNKIMPMMGNLIISACRRSKDSVKTAASRRRNRMANREEERRLKNEIKVDVEESAGPSTNGYENGHRISPRLHSPRNCKKERDEDYEKAGTSNGYHHNGMMNGNSANGHVNGTTNGKINGEFSPKSPRRRNGDLKNGAIVNGSSKRKQSAAAAAAAAALKKQEEEADEQDDLQIPAFIEDFDARLIGSKIVSKLIAGGILPESSAQIFDQMAKEGGSGTSKVQISEEGRDEVEDPTMDELSEELKRCQLELQEIQPQLNAVVTLAYRRAKAQYAFWYSFDQLRAADYDLFTLGVNNYRENPRRLPAIVEQPLLKSAMMRRNRQARFHYGNTYRRHPKYRWRLKPTGAVASSSSRKRTSISP